MKSLNPFFSLFFKGHQLARAIFNGGLWVVSSKWVLSMKASSKGWNMVIL